MEKPRVFLVDDDAGIRQLLTKALSRRGIEIVTFESAQAFLDYYKADEPGCLVLDLSMPGMSGLELQQELAKSGFNIPVIFITGHGNIPQSVQAMKAGAIDFLEKPFGMDELFARIDDAFRADSMLRKEQDYRQSIKQRFDTLTERENEVMRLLISGAATSSSKEIAAKFGISHRTVDHHRARIMEKTKARSVTELARLASWAGLAKVETDT